MEESIIKFNEQFSFEAEIENAEYLKDFDHIILCGMGGSHLAADLIKTIKPGIDIYVHKDYGLPPYEEDFLARGLLIACSYSGNTEETLSFFDEAYKRDLHLGVITTGGKLLEKADLNNVPYIKIPNSGIQPRQADGYLALAILRFLGDEEAIATLNLLEEKINPESFKEVAEEIAIQLNGKIPIIYSSNRNLHIAYNWKITFNETAKVPSFYNVFPELNHNEMQGFGQDVFNNTFVVIFLVDENDDSRVKRRMEITKEIYKEKGVPFLDVHLEKVSREEQVFSAIILADWAALSLAKKQDIDPENVPTIEDFKKRLASN